MEQDSVRDSFPPIEIGKMEASIFKKFCHIAYEKSGITLKPGKEALVTARVAKRQRVLGISSAKEYLAFLEKDNDDEMIFFLDAISTNYTHFFRENTHFEQLTREIGGWLSSGSDRIRIWSAASSTGEEPYSIVITALEAFDNRSVDFRLLATDISTNVLSKASSGIYQPLQLEPVLPALRNRYFNRVGRRNSPNEAFEIKPDVRSYVIFKRLNLSKPPFPMSGPLDAVFCRNVMIYFDQKVRQGLISEIERLLKPGGVLMIGHSETLTGINTGLRIECPSVYRKPGF